MVILLLACKGPASPVHTGDTGIRPPPPCPVFEAWQDQGTIPTPPAIEISGIAVSGGRIWVQNDGGTAEIHEIGADGALVGTLALDITGGRDHEDLAVGPGPDGEPWLYLADIGDNGRSRTSVFVRRTPVPAVTQGPVVPESLELVYEDGARDAETVFVDPDGAIWVASKELDGQTGLYRADDGILHRLATLPFGEPPLGQATQVTGGDFGPRGLVLRTYLETGFVWPTHPGEGVLTALEREPCTVALAPEPQAEAIGWSDAGLFTASEGQNPTLHFHPLAAP